MHDSTDPSMPSPLAPYMLNWRELTLVNHARSVALSSCLSDHGYRLPVGNLSSEIARARAQELVDLSRLYGITDHDVAARNGYWPDDVPSAEPIERVPQLALDRCVAKADRSVGRTPGRSPYGLARELLISSRRQLEQQPHSRSAIRRWVDCMARSGYRVTSPLNDHGDIARELHARDVREESGRAGPSRREVAIALADIDCKKSTDLVPQLERVGKALDMRALRANRLALRKDRQRLDAVLARTDGAPTTSAPAPRS